jgi:hypothetical protein
MIRIPDFIEIGGITYQVRFNDNLPAGRVAQIHFTDGTIDIESTMCTEVVFLSFMHEIVHGVMQSQNHFPNEMIYNDEDFTERTAQLMASIFKQIFVYNTHYEEFFEPQEEESMVEEEHDVIVLDVPELEE